MGPREVVIVGHHEFENRRGQCLGKSHEGVAFVPGARAVLGDDQRGSGIGENPGHLVELFWRGDDGHGRDPGRYIAVAVTNQQLKGDLQQGRPQRHPLGDEAGPMQFVHQAEDVRPRLVHLTTASALRAGPTKSTSREGHSGPGSVLGSSP